MNGGLDELIPDVFVALDKVSREIIGILPAMTIDAQASQAAVGQEITWGITEPSVGEDFVPGQLPPDTGFQSFDNDGFTIEKSRQYPFKWTGEERRGLNNGGQGQLSLQQQQIAQAFRAAINEMEAYAYGKVRAKISRAVGTVGTNPFATDIKNAAAVRQILVDNGTPNAGWTLIMDTNASTDLLDVNTKVNEAGTDEFVRNGTFADFFGGAMKESSGITSVAVGTGTAYQTNLVGGYPVGTTNIALDTGSGTILAGDLVTFAGDTHIYGVRSYAAGVLQLNSPGLRKTLADNVVMTILGAGPRNLAIQPGYALLATRVPDMGPKDSAYDSQIITDPYSGLSFDLRMYLEFGQIRYQIGIAYGAVGLKGDGIAALLG